MTASRRRWRLALPVALLLLLLTPAVLMAPSLRNRLWKLLGRPEMEPLDYAVRIAASVQKEPPRIALRWLSPPTLRFIKYRLYKKRLGEEEFGPSIALLSPTASEFVDDDVRVGEGYEYKIDTDSGDNRFGMIYAGIELPPVEDRGAVLLVVAHPWSAALAPELKRLEQDLVGDGWSVLRRDLPADTTVEGVKALVVRGRSESGGKLKAVFLLGHVPVPYSGDIYPDGHDDHRGAWPADAYYGTLRGEWTDRTVRRTSATARREVFGEEGPDANHNVPGDGKFDQSYLPGPVELQVGRVDLSNLPAFGQSEEALLRRYLEKDHAFRHRQGSLGSLPRRAILDDGMGDLWKTAPAASGWRNFSAMFGLSPNALEAGRWVVRLTAQDYLWAYGCGMGQGSSFLLGPSGRDSVSTGDFASRDFRAMFFMMFGSYFGDWDSKDNLLRAPLASARYGLASVWGGWPNWFVHPMALGETIGFSTQFTQNNSQRQYFQNTDPDEDPPRSVHLALMGDPTLRLHPVAPPKDLAVSPSDGGAVLTWHPSPEEALQGYCVYRADREQGPYRRLNPQLLSQTRFVDAAARAAQPLAYMVRAVKLEQTPSGSYFNLSQGTFAFGGDQGR